MRARSLAALAAGVFLLLWGGAAHAALCMPWDPRCVVEPIKAVRSACALGEEEVAPGRCCWRGQTWDEGALVCRGEATCAAPGLEASGGQCLPKTNRYVHHHARCVEGYLGDCWRLMQLLEIEALSWDYHSALISPALEPLLRPLCEAGQPHACDHLGAMLVLDWRNRQSSFAASLTAAPPQLNEGLKLLEAGCAAGRPDPCYALAQDAARPGTPRVTMGIRGRWVKAYSWGLERRWWGQRPGLVETSRYEERACALGHSLACDALLHDRWRDPTLKEAKRWQTIACQGKPMTRCAIGDALPRPDDPPRPAPMWTDLKELPAREGALRAVIEATHKSCLAGSLHDCNALESLGMEEHPFMHHPPLKTPLAPIKALLARHAIRGGEEAAALRCALNIDAPDRCGVEQALKKLKPAQRTAMLDALVHQCWRHAWGCSPALRLALLDHTRPSAAQLLALPTSTARPGAHTTEMLGQFLAGAGRQMMYGPTALDWLPPDKRPKQQRRPPSGSTAATELEAVTKLCRRAHIACVPAIKLAFKVGDEATFMQFHDRLGPLTLDELRRLLPVLAPYPLPAARYAAIADEAMARCRDTQRDCPTAIDMHQRLARKAGDETRAEHIYDPLREVALRRAPLDVNARLTLLRPACAAYDLRACVMAGELLAKRLDGEQEARELLMRACTMGYAEGCEGALPLVREAAAHDALKGLMCKRGHDAQCPPKPKAKKEQHTYPDKPTPKPLPTDRALTPAEARAAQLACIKDSDSCAELWRAWRDQRAPSIDLERGRLIGAMGCLSGARGVCTEYAQSRLVGRPDGEALAEATGAAGWGCLLAEGSSCDLVLKLNADGMLAAPARAELLTHMWSMCMSADELSLCSVMEALEGAASP